VEYAMIIAVLALVTVGALYSLSQQTGKLYSTIGSNLNKMTGSH
jgi:Flp pilus assembly pilin Flp